MFPDIAFQESVGGCGSCSRQNGGAKKNAKKTRKLSAYNIFMKKELASLKKQYPNMTAVERMKMAAKKWKATPSAHAATKSKSRKTRTTKRVGRSSSRSSRSRSSSR